MERWFTDLRDAGRGLARRPGFTLLAVGTLALGLSTSAAVFTYVNAYARPFPGVGASHLYQVWFATEDAPWGAISTPDFRDLAALDQSLFAVSGVGAGSFAASVRREDFTEIAYGQTVAGGFFGELAVDMTLGRGFSPEDERPGATPTAVLAHEYWVSRYASNPGVVGETILLNNEAYTIVGVAGAGFAGASEAYRPQFWIPFEQFLRVYRARSDTRENRSAGWVIPILRLADGVSPARAAEAIDAFASGLDDLAPLPRRTRRFVLEPATWISPETRASEAGTTRLMLAAAGFLLLLACANVANILLSAGRRRHRELAIRAAIGASRWRLIRRSLTESLLLSGVAGVAALALAGPVAARLSSYFARPSVWGANVPRELVVDPRVMAFAFAAAVVTGVVTGLVPALRTSASDPAAALRAGATRGATGHSSRRLPGTRDLFVSVQIAVCVVLLFVAGLVLRTLDAAGRVDPGFETDRTVASYVSTSSMGIAVDERHRFFQRLMERFEGLPWVEAATVSEFAPLSGHPAQLVLPPAGSDSVRATLARVWPGYFETLEIGIVRGRSFSAADTANSVGVAIVNETLAAALAADGSAVGRTIRLPGSGEEPDRAVEIVGVVPDVRQVTLLEDPGPVVYISLPQVYSRPGNALVLSVAGDPAVAVESMRRELRDIDTRIAILNILPYRDVVRGFLYTQRMNAELFSAIAGLGLLLAAAGVFAVLALAVAARRREIGIRMAIGADRRSIARAVLRPVGASVLAGLVVGLVGAFLATNWVESLLWGVAPADPVALGAGIGVLMVAVAVAVQIPLRRAMRVDPVRALQAE